MLVRLPGTSWYRLGLSAADCGDIAIRRSGGQHGTRSELIADQLFALLQQREHHDDGTSTLEVPNELVDALLAVIPTILTEYENDHAEMGALIDAWPEELEQVQAELLAALGRT